MSGRSGASRGSGHSRTSSRMTAALHGEIEKTAFVQQNLSHAPFIIFAPRDDRIRKEGDLIIAFSGMAHTVGDGEKGMELEDIKQGWKEYQEHLYDGEVPCVIVWGQSGFRSSKAGELRSRKYTEKRMSTVEVLTFLGGDRPISVFLMTSAKITAQRTVGMKPGSVLINFQVHTFTENDLELWISNVKKIWEKRREGVTGLQLLHTYLCAPFENTSIEVFKIEVSEKPRTRNAPNPHHEISLIDCYLRYKNHHIKSASRRALTELPFVNGDWVEAVATKLKNGEIPTSPLERGYARALALEQDLYQAGEPARKEAARREPAPSPADRGTKRGQEFSHSPDPDSYAYQQQSGQPSSSRTVHTSTMPKKIKKLPDERR